MPRKQKTVRKPRRPRRKKSAKVTRIALFTLGFVVLTFIAVYGLNVFKHKMSDSAPGGLTQSRMSESIGSADNKLRSAYFDMGISSGSVRSEKTQQKERGRLSWEYKDIVIRAPKALSEKEIKIALNESFADTPDIENEFKKTPGSLTAYIKVDDLTTHRIKFEFPVPKKDSGKAAKKETKEAPDKLSGKQADKKKDIKDAQKKPAQKSVAKLPQDKGGVAKPRVVIIVDDIGMNKSPIDELLKLPAPVTIAVLPNLPYSDYAARQAHKKGREVMLHLPMEPKESSGYTGVDAGEDALLVGLPKTEILRRLDKNLSSVPHIQGVNNHMGSKFMESGELLELVLREIKGKELFFVDSKTSGASMGYEAATKLGVRSAERDVFLDDSSKGSSYVQSQLRQLVKISQKKGYAIGICHPYPGTVKALSEMLPSMQNEVDIVSVSSVLDRELQIGKNED